MLNSRILYISKPLMLAKSRHDLAKSTSHPVCKFCMDFEFVQERTSTFQRTQELRISTKGTLLPLNMLHVTNDLLVAAALSAAIKPIQFST